MSWSLFMCYLLPEPVTGRIHSRLSEAVFSGFPLIGSCWLCLLQLALWQSREPSTSPTLQLPCPHEGGAGCESAWHAKESHNWTEHCWFFTHHQGGNVVSWVQRTNNLEPKRGKRKRQRFHWRKACSWPQFSHLWNFNEKIRFQTLSQGSIR